jgi:O-antigen/teichoic acid export membrane protein
MVLGLITNVFIIRKLSINDYGVFSIAFMFIGLITTFGFSWSSSSILYYGSREKAKYGSINKTFWSRNIIMFISVIITTGLFIVFRKEINNYIGEQVSFLILIWLYISIIEDYLSQYYLAINKQLLSNILSVTAKLIYLILVLSISFDVRTLIILNITSHSIVILYIGGINKKDIGSFEFDKQWFKEILNFSLWQLFGFSGLYLINFGDTAVIKYFMTTQDVGIYNSAYKLFTAVAGFSYVISNYYASNVSQMFIKRDHYSIKKFFYKERYLIFLLSIAAHLIVIIFSRFIIISLYGERYHQAILIFNILMIGSIFSFWGVFNMLYFNTNNKHKINQMLNLFRAILNILLDILLVIRYGIIGAAIATSLSLIVTSIISTYYSEKGLREVIKQ